MDNPTTTGEWTSRVEGDRLYFSTGYWDIGETNARTLEVTINAALAASVQYWQGVATQEWHKGFAAGTEQLAAEREKVENLHGQLLKSHARMSERKSVHQWLTAQNIPEEENGKRICLLRRLRITLDRLAEQENEAQELKDANRGLYIESNERKQALAVAVEALKFYADKRIYPLVATGHLKADAALAKIGEK